MITDFPARSKEMKHRARSILLLILILAAIVAAALWFTRPEPVKVLVKQVESGRIEATVANTRAGTVKARRRALLAPAIGGQIARLPVHKGMAVKSGEVLLVLWNDDLRAEVDLAASEAEAAAANARAACLQADIADRQAKRYTELQKTSAIAEDQVDQTVTTARVRRSDCLAAEASARVSKSREAAARAQLERTIVKAPFAGLVADINGEVGEYVTPSPPGIPTLPVIDLVDAGSFYVTAPIDEVDAPAIRPGMAARITLDAFPGRHFPGRVQRIADYVLDREKQARTVDIEVMFTEPGDTADLLAGYSADAEVIVDSKENVLRIPTEAVLDNQRVFVYLPDKLVLAERQIETGLSNWDYTEAVRGLKEGEWVVLSVDRKGVKDGARAVAE